MTGGHRFPELKQGRFFMCEGGTETEIMYRYGFEFPHFSAFELLKNPQAMARLTEMYEKYFAVVARYRLSALVGGLDYRASPDWAAKLGYTNAELERIIHQCMAFLRKVAEPFSGEIEEILFQGTVGPRGEAYDHRQPVSIDAAQQYHSLQLSALKDAGVDLVTAMTFNSVEESVGIARAAKDIGVPICISLSLDSGSRLSSGPTLAEAIQQIDEYTDNSVEFFMINCVHPLEYEPALLNDHWVTRIRGVRPNASAMDKVSLCNIGHIEDGDPAELGRQVGDLIRRYPHMDIVGGCCGTWDAHLEQMAANIV